MKQKDIFVVIATIFVSSIFAFIICNSFIFSAQNDKQKAEVVQPISSQFKLPDTAIFNTEATNPTKVIEIGPNSNNSPFTNAN